jgi:hypothetical protein
MNLSSARQALAARSRPSRPTPLQQVRPGSPDGNRPLDVPRSTRRSQIKAYRTAGPGRGPRMAACSRPGLTRPSTSTGPWPPARAHPQPRPSDRRVRVAGQATAGRRPRDGHVLDDAAGSPRVPSPSTPVRPGAHRAARLMTLDPDGARGQRAHPRCARARSTPAMTRVGGGHPDHGPGLPPPRLVPMKDFSARAIMRGGFRRDEFHG